MPNNRLISMLMALGMLGACSDGNKRDLDAQNDNGSDFSVRMDGEDGGTVSIKVPGLSGDFGIPSLKLDNAKVDIDGVQLYPGAELTGVDISGENGGDDGSVIVRFQSAASPAEIQNYYLDAFKEKGLTTSAQGNTITGISEDGKPFSIALTEEGEMTRGTIHFTKGA